MAAANGVRRIWIGQNGLLSTPAVSAVIRERVGVDVSHVFCNLLLFLLSFSLNRYFFLGFIQDRPCFFSLGNYFPPELKKSSA